ncbi:MAG: sterol desaturase family protein [Bacteriovoracaceae bacterium]|nr:sterol desaturase family protein [Bacteriovoracaceae bacterium]
MTINENLIRLIFFFGTLIIIAVWELVLPRLKLNASKLVRWYSNLGIVFMNTAIVRLIFPLTATGVAQMSDLYGWGLLNIFNMPFVFSVVVSVIVLDLAIYLQHVMFHAIPLLWRLHRMHHTDVDFDVTSGARFHPIEIVLSMGIKLAVITIIGAPVLSVVIFEVLLSTAAMFNHGNIYIAPGIDRYLRWLVVTPDMHRIHHSVWAKETNSNFGFNLPWWDRLFGTYTNAPRDGQQKITIGIKMFRDPINLHLYRLLLQPFLADRGRKE